MWSRCTTSSFNTTDAPAEPTEAQLADQLRRVFTVAADGREPKMDHVGGGPGEPRGEERLAGHLRDAVRRRWSRLVAAPHGIVVGVAE